MKKKVFSLMMTLLLAVLMPGAMFAQVTPHPDLHTKALSAAGVEIIDTLCIDRPNGAWMEPYHFQLFNNGADSIEVVYIDFLHNNGYFTLVEGELPYNGFTGYPVIVPNDGLLGAKDFYILTDTSWVNTTGISDVSLAVNTTQRSTHLFKIVANPYMPYCPDVYELAYNLDTLRGGDSWQHYMSDIWEAPAAPQLYHNYNLPDFADETNPAGIPDGYDAVLKFTVDEAVILNASVTDGNDGKVVLYTENFYGKPGPMENNYYRGRPYHPNADDEAPVVYYDFDFEDTIHAIPAGFHSDSTATNIPWIIDSIAAYTGAYGMMSGNAGVNNSSSAITMTVDYEAAGTVSFDFFASGESDDYSNVTYDSCVFMIDNEIVFVYGEDNTWRHFETEVAAGEHTFTWVYTKDVVFGSIYDAFMVDNVVFEGGHVVIIPDPVWDEFTYDFEDGMQGWTVLQDTVESTSPNTWMHNTAYTPRPDFATDHGRNYSDGFMLSESFISEPTEGSGTPVIPDNYLISPKIMLGGYIHFWATSPSQNFGEEHFSVEVSTTNNTDINAFSVVDSCEWTLPLNELPAGRTGNTRTIYDNEWFEYEADLRAFSDSGYVAIHHYNCQDLWMLCVDDITLYAPHTETPVEPTPEEPEVPEEPIPTYTSTAGPVINNLNVLPGTYYLVASSTDPDFEVSINIDALPCPEAVTNIYPVDNDREVNIDQDLILRWKLNDNCTEWRLVFSSTYWPEDEPADTTATPDVPGHPMTIITPWSNDLQESFNVSQYLVEHYDGLTNFDQLWHNTNYFWRIEQRNDNCTFPGPVFGFTTCLNRPLNMTASITRMFEHEDTLILTWDAVVDRTYRQYRIYMDDSLIGTTELHAIDSNFFVVPSELLTYNLDQENGYIFEVTAVYDEGESPRSNPFEIYVSGCGVISGTVYEQDGETGIGGATVTINGFNDFMVPETYTYTTNSVGFYSDSTIHAGNYFEDSLYYGIHYFDAVASMEGYQDATTVHELPFDLPYNDTVDHVDFLMDELFVAPAHVCAETAYVPGVVGDTLVQVWWDFNFFTTLGEDFEDWENTPFEWQNDETYPWEIVQEGPDSSFCMKSTNSGVHGTTSSMEVTVFIPQDGEFSFDYRSDGESTTDTYDWDVSRFFMDGEQVFQYGRHMVWEHFATPITAGTHTFKWVYKKDGSVNPSAGDDCFRVDNIVFVGLAGSSVSRALHHYNIYRTDCYNDGPYTSENTTFLATVWRPDTAYYDVSWPQVPAGVYKYGVSAVYQGNYEGNPNNPRVDYPFEPRESEIVWSNEHPEWNCGMGCIDKDMWAGVTVNVLCNSADSPEGAVVDFEPLDYYGHARSVVMPVEEEQPVSLDPFRKGDYRVTVSLPGYVTIVDTVSIWQPTDLRYVLIEIIYGVKDLYVSRTGWAKWRPITPFDVVEEPEADTTEEGRATRHLEGFKVMCTSIDDVPIFNHNNIYYQPFCQLDVDELVPGEFYKVKACAIYSTGQSEWCEPVIWQYEPCDNWGPVDEVAVNTVTAGNHIEWVFEHGHNQWEGDLQIPEEWADDWTGGGDTPEPPTPVNNATVILTAGDVWGDNSGYQMLLDADATAYGNEIPTSGPYTETNYNAFEYFIPVDADCSQTSTHIVFENSISIEIPAGTYDWCITNPSPGTMWIASDQGNVGGRQDDYVFEAGKTYEFTVTPNEATGNDQTNVVITGGAKNMKAPLPCGKVKTMSFAKKGGTSVIYNLNNIMNYNERVFFLYNLVNDGRFDVVNAETAGRFIITADDAFEGMNVEEAFSDFREQNAANYAMMDKEEACATAARLKPMLPADFMQSLLSYDYTRSRANDMCALAHPVCSDSTYFFPAPVGTIPAEEGPDYDCLISQPRPVWYYFRIGVPGSMDIYMSSTPQIDIDFCCWGPFDDPVTPCPNGLTEDKVVSCSFSASWNETCVIPETAQAGEYYILVITNYNGGACDVTFNKVDGEGDTDCAIVVDNDPAIGFLITQDGEYLDIVGPDVREYTDIDEFGDHVYCVRPIYGGPAILPDTNYYFSMGCPVCVDMTAEPICDAGDPIYAEVNDAEDQVHLWWGTQPEPPVPGEGFLMDFEGVTGQALPEGWTTIDADPDPANWYTLNWMEAGWTEDENVAHSGDTWVTSASWNQTALNPDNYLVSPQVSLDGTLTFWACAQDAEWAAEHFGVAVSTAGNTNAADFNTIAEWTMTAKGTGARTPDTRSRANRAGNWYEYTVDLSDYAGQMGYVAIRHFNCTDMFRLNVDDIELAYGRMGNRAGEIVSYNIYRSEDNVDYQLIGNVPANDDNWYEYFDAPGTGNYYYQVTAVYADGCESEPAVSGENPEVNYVMVGVTGLGENTANVNLFPNPTKDNVTIQAKGMNHITVMSVLGQVVYDTKVAQDEYVLNMGQFNTGMYMVRISTESGVVVKRVNVMH